MDAVRGTAILLLLVWHASAIPELYGQEMPEAVRAVNAFFLPYRMPTLMLLSGMLLSRSLSKPLPTYYAGKFSMILWPYVIWVIIAKLTFLEVVGLSWWHWRAWYATSYLWFLFFIGVYYLIAPAFARLPLWVPVALFTAVGAILPADSTEQRMAYFAVFFFAGNWMGRYPETLTKILRSRWIAVAAVPVVALGIASSVWTDIVDYTVWTAPVSLAGALLLAAVFSRMSDAGRGTHLLQWLGRSSLVYYVSHFPVMAAISMSPVGQLPGLLVALINLLAALAVGWVLARWKDRVPLRWLFEAPTPLVRGVRRLLSAASPRRSGEPVR